MQSLLTDLMTAVMYVATFYNTVGQTWFLNKAIYWNLVWVLTSMLEFAQILGGVQLL